MQSLPVQDFNSYRQYLKSRLGGPKQRTGQKLAASEFIGCHSGYLTRVLKEEAHFSLEQADRFNQFMRHTSEESHFFLLLVHRDRAGTKSLQQYFDAQIAKIREQRTLLHKRLNESRLLGPEDEARYYSQWYFSAIHVLLSIQKYQKPEPIATYLGLPMVTVMEALEFLARVRLAIKDGELYTIGPSYLYAGPDSPNLSRHHSNWRMKSIQTYGQASRRDDVHFSAAVTLSYADFEKYKEVLRKRLEEDMEFFKASKEEGGFAICIDLFEIGN